VRLDELGRSEQTPVATLLVSELVTNAVLHGKPPFTVSVDVVDDSLRVTVDDGDPDHLPRQHVSNGEPDERVGGFGLQFLADLADDFGWSVRSNRKSVWFMVGHHHDHRHDHHHRHN
jgi:anti-sigma regulatory factor (Ser/Thr protein kinase)